MKTSLRLAVSLTALAALAAYADTTYSFVRVPKEGETREFEFTGEVEIMGMNVKLEGKQFEKVEKIVKEGYTFSQMTKDLKVILPSGQAMEQDPGEPSTGLASLDGTTLKVDGAKPESDGDMDKLDILSTVKKPDSPVKIGEEWSSKIKGPEGTEANAVAKYKLLGTEKIGKWDTIKVEVNSQMEDDSAVKMHGTIWLETDTFFSVKMDGSFENITLPGSPDKSNLKLSRIRVK